MFANLAKHYDYDKEAFEDGRWVAIEGGRVKIRSHQSAHSKATRKKLEMPHLSLIKQGRGLPEEVVEELTIKQMAQSLIMDWDGEGFQDESGVKVPATPENIETALRDYQHFRDDMGSLIASRDTFKRMDLETGAKN